MAMADTIDPLARSFNLDQFVDQIVDGLRAGEKRLGLPAGTLIKMASEDDYLLVIKMIATIEPAINELIAKGMSRPIGLGGDPASKFAGVVEFSTKLPLNGRSSKIEFAEALGVLRTSDKKFIDALSQIRNRYAHNIRNASRTFLDMVSEAERNDKSITTKLFRVPMSTSNWENGGMKLFLMSSFSTFLQNAEAEHEPLRGPMTGVLAGLLNHPIPTDTGTGK